MPWKRPSLDELLELHASVKPGYQKPKSDELGFEAWNGIGTRATEGHPVPPIHYPASGSACYRCPGTEDSRCCQYKNQSWEIPS